MFRAFALVLSLAVLVPSVHAAPPLAQVEVTTCGQVVPNKTVGYLSADLDCTGFTGGPANVHSTDAGAAVYLQKKSSLDLRGFTLTGGDRYAVLCDALLCDRNRFCTKGPCEVFGGTLVSSAQYSNGIVGWQPNVHDVTVSGFWIGLVSYKRLTLTSATVDDSQSAGVMGRGLRIASSTITDSVQFGVIANNTQGARLRITDSTVTGSGTAPFCTALSPCADVASVQEPRLVSTTCDTSFSFDHGPNWGVCAND